MLVSGSVHRFGFITFEDVATAKKMLNKHNGAQVDGRVIEMRFAEERRSTPQSGGGGGRSWGRGGGGGGGFRGRGGGRGEVFIFHPPLFSPCLSFTITAPCHFSFLLLMFEGRGGRGGFGAAFKNKGSIQEFRGQRISFNDED